MTQPKRRTPRRASQTPEYLAIGRVLRPHGVRGEIRLQSLTDTPEHLADVQTVYIGEAYQPYKLERSRLHQHTLMLTLAECADRTTADTLRGQTVYIALTDARPLKPGQYYHHQIIGLPVRTEDGETLGKITEILQTGANDVYVVTDDSGGELLLPAIKSVVREITAEQMIVHLLPGLRQPKP